MNAYVFAVLLVAAGDAKLPGRSVTGVVRDQQGAVMRDVRVIVQCPGSPALTTTTSAVGAFAVTGLPEARCVVSAESSLFRAARADVDLRTAPAVAVQLSLDVRSFTEEVVVTATPGFEERSFALSEPTSVLDRGDIDRRPYQLLPQVLREEPGILLQQTTTAQASPVIRGFTGPSNVYLVDGVRFNTASWRSGPSQYLAWIDPAAVDRLEIVRGPTSVQYGSDAMGGALNAITSQPLLTPGQPARVGVRVDGGFGTADRSGGTNGEVAVQGSRAAFRVGASVQRVDDLRAGGGLDSHAAVTRFLGLPSDVLGSRMTNTGFDQSGAYFAGTARIGGRGRLSTFYLHDVQRGVSRYDRILGGEGLYRSGFTPQALDFTILRYQQPAPGFDSVSATFSVNRQDDGRFEQARPTARLDRQESTTTALGYQVLASRRYGSRHQTTYGAELYDETIDGFRFLDEPTGVTTAARPDIPDGTRYRTFGVYAQHAATIVPDRLSIRGGVRYGRFHFSTAPDQTLGVTADDVQTSAVTFHAGTVIRVARPLNATFSVSRGFRAPNAADFGSIGLTGGTGFEITPGRAAALGGVVGSADGLTAVSTGTLVGDLRPESLYAFEPGLRFQKGRVAASVTAFDLELFDTIQRRSVIFPASVLGVAIAGFDVVRVDAAGRTFVAQDARPIGTRVNVDRGRILGVDVQGEWRVAAQWTASAYWSMANGRLLPTGDYIRGMPPPLGGAVVRWIPAGGRAWIEGTLAFAQAQTRLSSGDLSDARIGAMRTRASIATFFNGTATDIGLVRNGILLETGETLAQVQTRVLGGAASAPLYTETPGFAAFGVRTGVRLARQLELIVIGENITDRNYRLHRSGVDAPGANLQVRTRVTF